VAGQSTGSDCTGLYKRLPSQTGTSSGRTGPSRPAAFAFEDCARLLWHRTASSSTCYCTLVAPPPPPPNPRRQTSPPRPPARQEALLPTASSESRTQRPSPATHLPHFRALLVRCIVAHHGRRWPAQPAHHQYVLHSLHRRRPPPAVFTTKLTTMQSLPPMGSTSAMCSVCMPSSRPTSPARSCICCRISRPLRRGHNQWRADAHHERHQEDAEPLLERELRHVRWPGALASHTFA
jgi:hypothetical protein